MNPPTDQPMTATTPTEAQDTTPTEPTGHDEAVEVVANYVPLGFTERDPYANVPEAAQAIVAALSSAGFLATEQEWRVVSGGATSPYATPELAAREVHSLAGIEIAGHVETRRVTAWTEVDT